MVDETLRRFERALLAGDAAEVLRLGPAVLRIARGGADPTPPSFADTVSIDDADLSKAVKNALRAVGIRTAGHLADLTDDEVLCLSNIGRTRLGEIRRWLGGLGLRTRFEGDPPRFDVPPESSLSAGQSLGRLRAQRGARASFRG